MSITTCSSCTRLYCEQSEESANRADRLCRFCFDRAMKHPGKCRCEICVKPVVWHAKFRALTGYAASVEATRRGRG